LAHSRLKSDLWWHFHDSPENGDGTVSPAGGATTLGGRTAISGGATPETGCETPFWLNLIATF